eukprot:COSAG01_NODE_33479_length_563_cov_1.178879_1_plen_75_part_01
MVPMARHMMSFLFTGAAGKARPRDGMGAQGVERRGVAPIGYWVAKARRRGAEESLYRASRGGNFQATPPPSLQRR